MITRRKILSAFSALFGGVTAPDIIGPPAGVNPENPQAKATGIVHIEWCSRSRSWKRTDTWVMIADGDELAYHRYDDQGKETHVNRYSDQRHKTRSYRVGRAKWPKES